MQIKTDQMSGFQISAFESFNYFKMFSSSFPRQFIHEARLKNSIQ